MKTSELIKFLEKSIKEHGDLDIVTPKYETPDSLYPYYDEIYDCSWGYETDINGNKVREFIEIFKNRIFKNSIIFGIKQWRYIMCQICEMRGDGKRHMELKVQWTDQNSNSVQVKSIQDITVSIVDWTKSENECTQIGKMKYCWNCGKKLED